jgi:hypothetical protein
MSLPTNHSSEEDEKMLVLRHTELYINFSYNNIFSLLYKFLVMQVHPRKIRLIEGNEKCPNLKNGLVKGLCGRCLSVRGPELHTPPPYTLHKCSILYLFTHGSGGGGRVQPERRGEGQQFTKLGRKYQHD